MPITVLYPKIFPSILRAAAPAGCHHLTLLWEVVMQNVLKLQMFAEAGPGGCTSSNVSCPSVVSCESNKSSAGEEAYF
jgi:hypothetical protein